MAARTDTPRLNECCAILKPVETQAASGGMQTTWEYLSQEVYAEVRFPGTGTDEQFLGDQQVATTRVEFTIRFRDDFNEKYRWEYAGEEYDIKNIIRTGERRSYLKVITEKRT